MERDKEAELKELEEREKIRRAPGGDLCPHCLQPVATFPYVDGILRPDRIWIECPFCGVVFCPKSVREARIKDLTGQIAIDKHSLLVPAYG